MTAKVILLNKQKGQRLDLKWLESNTDKLFGQVLDNLKKYPSPQVKKKLIAELKERGTLSLVLVSNAQIKKLNKQWMDKDYATDVLSFPLSLEAPPEPLPWEVGELVISVEKALSQAQEFGHSFEREFAFLFVHGFLHILGFDHMEPEEEKEMFGRQKQILLAAGFPRGKC